MQVRNLVAGRHYPFVIATTSSEYHPGRVEVEWSVTVFVNNRRVVARGLGPTKVYEDLEALMREIAPSSAPVELQIFGEPPDPTGAP